MCCTMIENTINEGRTAAGGGKDMILAGRYHILRQLGQKISLNTGRFRADAISYNNH